MQPPPFERIFGVDFSGARRAGDATWVAELRPPAPRRTRFVLTSLHRMSDLAGTADRGAVLRSLVELVRASDAALWGLDLPFGLPVELFPAEARWRDQFAFLAEWGEDAYGCGLECVRRALAVAERMHIRRTTDAEAKAPFDAFHYRRV